MQNRQQTGNQAHARTCPRRRDGRVDRAISAARTARVALERCDPTSTVEG